MRLAHRGLGAMENILGKGFEVDQLLFTAVYVPVLLTVHKEEMILARAPEISMYLRNSM